MRSGQRPWRRMMGGLGVTLTAVLAGCGSGPSSPGNEPRVTLKYSCPCTDQQPQTQAMKRFADEVKKLTKDAVTIEVFANGSLLSQNVEFQGLQKGSTDIADTDPSQYAAQAPAMQILLTPYLFTKWSQVQDTFGSPDGQKLIDQAVQKVGVRPLDIQNLGARELNLNLTKTIRTPADMNGVKLRMPPGPYWTKLGQAMGAQVTPVAFNEIYLALQTGTVQGQDNPVATDVTNKFYEVTKQMILTNHVFSAVLPTINEKSWVKLSPAEQKAVVQAMKDADVWADAQVQDGQVQNIKFLQQHGLKVSSPDTAAFQAAVLKSFLCDPSFTGAFLPGMLKEIEKATKTTAPSC
jgi:tripartite ATP-independent transporter DctP family solute receptor